MMIASVAAAPLLLSEPVDATAGFLYYVARSASATDSGATTFAQADIGGLLAVGAAGCTFFGSKAGYVHGSVPQFTYHWSTPPLSGTQPGPIQKHHLVQNIEVDMEPNSEARIQYTATIVNDTVRHPLDPEQTVDEATAPATLVLWCPVPGAVPPDDCEYGPGDATGLLQDIQWLCPL